MKCSANNLSFENLKIDRPRYRHDRWICIVAWITIFFNYSISFYVGFIWRVDSIEKLKTSLFLFWKYTVAYSWLHGFANIIQYSIMAKSKHLFYFLRMLFSFFLSFFFLWISNHIFSTDNFYFLYFFFLEPKYSVTWRSNKVCRWNICIFFKIRFICGI